MAYPPISLALTHFNRVSLLKQAVSMVLADPRVAEVVVSDDASTPDEVRQLREWQPVNVRICYNPKNLDCYRNKRAVVFSCLHNWVILFDSDNVMTPGYLDALGDVREWREDTAYLPVFAEPHFDYREFSGATVTRSNVASFVDRPHFFTALNTANYFFHRNTYLGVWDGTIDPHTADSMYQNYNWLKAGYKLHFVPGLQYFHRIHEGSHYKLNVHKTGNFAAVVERKIRELR